MIMDPIKLIAGRDIELVEISPLALNLLLALVSILLFTLLLVSILILFRRYQRPAKQDTLPLHKRQMTPPMRPMHRRTHSTYSIPLTPPTVLAAPGAIIHEKHDAVNATSTPLPSPLPEIRITFPDEIDEAGKSHSGRVMVVHVGHNSEGLAPLDEEENHNDVIHQHIRALEPFPTL